MFYLASSQVTPFTCPETTKCKLGAVYFTCSWNSSRISVSGIDAIPTMSGETQTYLLRRSPSPLRGQSK